MYYESHQRNNDRASSILGGMGRWLASQTTDPKGLINRNSFVFSLTHHLLNWFAGKRLIANEGCFRLFRPSTTVSRIGLMESCTCRYCRCHCCCRGGPPPPTTTPLAWHENVMDGWGARPLRWLCVLVTHGFMLGRSCVCVGAVILKSDWKCREIIPFRSTPTKRKGLFCLTVQYHWRLQKVNWLAYCRTKEHEASPTKQLLGLFPFEEDLSPLLATRVDTQLMPDSYWTSGLWSGNKENHTANQ